MLDHFEDDLFVEIIDHIQVVNRETLDFHLRCGLVLKRGSERRCLDYVMAIS